MSRPESTSSKPTRVGSIAPRVMLLLLSLIALGAWLTSRPRPDQVQRKPTIQAEAIVTTPTAGSPSPTVPDPRPITAVSTSKPPVEAVPKPEPEQEPEPSPIAKAPSMSETEVEEALARLAEDRERVAQAVRAWSNSLVGLVEDLGASMLEVNGAKQRGRALEIARKRLSLAATRLAALRVERDRVEKDLTALEQVERPAPRPLLSRNPLAKPPVGEEFHFEVHRGRVAVVELERLLDRLQGDATMRMKLARDLKPIRGEVGPIGSYRLKYELGPSTEMTLDDFLIRGKVSFGLQAWELVGAEPRGETLMQAVQPTSEFARAVRRLNPSRDTITLWIYPDSFQLYRELRDGLHSLGFAVSARPLPEGIPIRGSPGGTTSAVQ